MRADITMKKSRKIVVSLLLVVASSLLCGCGGGARSFSRIYKKSPENLTHVEIYEWRAALPTDVLRDTTPWDDSTKKFFEHIDTLYEPYSAGAFSYIDVKFTYRLYFNDDKTVHLIHCMSDDRLIARISGLDQQHYISLLPVGGDPNFTL